MATELVDGRLRGELERLGKKNSKDQGQINAVVGFWEVLNILFFLGHVHVTFIHFMFWLNSMMICMLVLLYFISCFLKKLSSIFLEETYRIKQVKRSSFFFRSTSSTSKLWEKNLCDLWRGKLTGQSGIHDQLAVDQKIPKTHKSNTDQTCMLSIYIRFLQEKINIV